MFELDQRFFNNDGSVNVEAAMTAGRKARAEGLPEGCGIVRDAVAQLILSLWRAVAGSCTRISPSRVFRDRTA
jgi:hypothetical protein